MLDFSIMKKMTADSIAKGKAKGRKLGSTHGLLVNIGPRKDTGVLFRLNNSIYQHTGIGCYTIS